MQAGLLKTYSPALVDRYHNVCAAVASVAPLHDDWQAMVDGSQTAIQVVTDIQTHDALAAEALQFATQGLYPEALAKLNGAAASITDATSVAAALARVTDVSTLTQWLSRTTQMDDALQLLWQSMVDSKGKVTAQVTAALRAVNDAKALLPDDNAVLQVVLQEMSSNMTSAGIAIETTRGALANALAGLGSGTVVGR
jgi:phosphoenolpyruvate-protein kinase (PTS system EI component)